MRTQTSEVNETYSSLQLEDIATKHQEYAKHSSTPRTQWNKSLFLR